MAVSYGPKLGLIINALTGDTYDVALRAVLRSLDQLQFLRVKSRIVTAPPGSPANGDAYIVATGGSGAWTGHDKSVAVWTTDNPATPGGLWEFHVPNAGWLAYSDADAGFYSYSGSAWAVLSGGSGGPTLKVNGTLNLDQALLNLIAGTNVTITDGGGGAITIAASGGGGGGGAPSGAFHAFGVSQPGTLFTFACSPVNAGGSVGGPFGSNPGCPGPPPYGFRLQGASTYCTYSDQALQMTPAITAQIQFYAAMGQTATFRSWMGFSTAAGGTLNATNPAGNIIAFRFDASVDTHWMAYVATSAGSFTATSTGVAPDTNFHQFKIARDGTGGWNFYIDGVLVANIPTGSTGMPVSTQLMAWIAEVDSGSTTANLYLNAMQWWSVS
jgi:hypothetical protein